MKITRRADYAVHLISDLSGQADSCLGLRSLAEVHGVTYAFARTVQQGLLKAGIIKASRGINGGIKLARPLEEITLLEVFESVQDSLDATFDNSGASWCNCEKGSCVSDQLWGSAKEAMREALSKITMENVLGER